MLPINVQTTDSTSILTLILPLLLCCMLPTLFRSPANSRGTNESDSWFVNTNIQDTYNAVVKETDEWRSQASEKKSSGLSSVFSRGKKPEAFAVDQAISPRLYRVKDRDRGEVSFELTEVEGGGTSIKSVYDSSARVLIQNFKAKLPAMIPSTAPKVCPSCGKDVLPEFKACPYCGAKL